MIYFWSDTHFNHHGVIEMCNRPYRNAIEMNEAMIDTWNKTVGKTDDIYHLGDFGFTPSVYQNWKGQTLLQIFDRLNGHKHLIQGNHDDNNKVLTLPWESINKLKTIKYEGMRVIACHFPLESWEGMWRNYIHLHGHCHGLLKRKVPRRFDIGVDVEPHPIDIKTMYLRAMNEQFVPQDGHGEQFKGDM